MYLDNINHDLKRKQVKELRTLTNPVWIEENSDHRGILNKKPTVLSVRLSVCPSVRLSVCQKKYGGALIALTAFLWNYKTAFRSGQRPKNPRGKTAHTDHQFKYSLESFNQPYEDTKG